MVQLPFDHECSPLCRRIAKYLGGRNKTRFYEYNPRDVADVYERIAAFRDGFFAWARGVQDIWEPDFADQTLWEYFTHWISIEYNDLNDGRKPVWLDRRRRADIWGDFLRLVPLIYLAVIDEVMQDRHKFDFVADGVAIHRPVTTVLPLYREPDAGQEVPVPDDEQFGPLVEMIVGHDGLWPAMVNVTPLHPDDLKY